MGSLGLIVFPGNDVGSAAQGQQEAEPGAGAASNASRSPCGRLANAASGLCEHPKVPELWGPRRRVRSAPVTRGTSRRYCLLRPANSDFRPNSEVDADRVSRLRLQDEAEAAATAQVFFQTEKHGRDAGNSARALPGKPAIVRIRHAGSARRVTQCRSAVTSS